MVEMIIPALVVAAVVVSMIDHKCVCVGVCVCVCVC